MQQDLYMVVYCPKDPDVLKVALVQPHHEAKAGIASRERFSSESAAQIYAVQLAETYDKKLGFTHAPLLDEDRVLIKPKIFVWRSTARHPGFPKVHVVAAMSPSDGREIVRRAFKLQFGFDRILGAMLEQDICGAPEIHPFGAMFMA